jgi:lipopolysaccharide transport system permease protein
LGAAWNIINPLAMIVVYTVIFSQLMKSRLPSVDNAFGYSVYLCAGILTWGLFAEIIGRAQNTFIENANLLKKLSFPRLCLPVVVVVNALLNFAITFALFTVFLLLSDNFPGLVYIAVLPLLIILIVFAIGLGITLGVLNVFFRDVGHFFSIFVQFWFWFTPIVYPISALPTVVEKLMIYNPMASLIAAFQAVLVSRLWPQWDTLGYPFTLALLLCLVGISLFRRHVGEMVDEL